MPGYIPEGVLVGGDAHCSDDRQDQSRNLADERHEVGVLPLRMPGQIQEHLHGSCTGRKHVRADSAKN